MKDIADLKKEIVELLLSKVKAVVDGYREKWEEDLVELFGVKGDMENLETHKAGLLKEQSKLRPLVNKELARRNDIDREVHRLEKTLSATRKKINELTARP